MGASSAHCRGSYAGVWARAIAGAEDGHHVRHKQQEGIVPANLQMTRSSRDHKTGAECGLRGSRALPHAVLSPLPTCPSGEGNTPQQSSA